MQAYAVGILAQRAKGRLPLAMLRANSSALALPAARGVPGAVRQAIMRASDAVMFAFPGSRIRVRRQRSSKQRGGSGGSGGVSNTPLWLFLIG